MEILPINSNINKSYRSKALNNIQNLQSETNNLPEVPIETWGAYTLTSLNNKTSKTYQTDLLLTNEQVEPRISITLRNGDLECPIMYPIYDMALHDEINETLKNNPQIKDNGSFAKEGIRKFDFTVSQDNIKDNLDLIKNNFINVTIQPKHIDEAKRLAPIWFELYKKGAETDYSFNGVPKDMTVEDYTKLVNETTYKDINDYNKSFIKNSDFKICLCMNKDFYNSNKETIDNTLM